MNEHFVLFILENQNFCFTNRFFSCTFSRIVHLFYFLEITSDILVVACVSHSISLTYLSIVVSASSVAACLPAMGKYHVYARRMQNKWEKDASKLKWELAAICTLLFRNNTYFDEYFRIKSIVCLCRHLNIPWNHF